MSDNYYIFSEYSDSGPHLVTVGAGSDPTATADMAEQDEENVPPVPRQESISNEALGSARHSNEATGSARPRSIRRTTSEFDMFLPSDDEPDEAGVWVLKYCASDRNKCEPVVKRIQQVDVTVSRIANVFNLDSGSIFLEECMPGGEILFPVYISIKFTYKTY